MGVSTPSQAAFKDVLPALGGLGQRAFFQYVSGQDATFGDEMETCWTNCILFRSRFEEKSPSRLLGLPWGEHGGAGCWKWLGT